MFFVLLSLLLGCSTKTSPTIARVRFEGNGHPFSLSNDQNLRSAMVQKEVSWLESLRSDNTLETFDPLTLQLDAWRIENWYAQHGYINARLVGWSVYSKPNRIWNRHKRVVITGVVEEGEQVHIRSIEWRKDSRALLQRELDKKLGMEVGAPLNWDMIEYSKMGLLTLAQNRSYAYADVDISVDVWPRNCHQLLEQTGECLAQQVKAQCLNTPEDWCDDVLPQLKKCSTDWCLEQLATPYEAMKEAIGEPVADIVVHFKEGPSCKFGEVEWLSETAISMDVLQEQIPFSPGGIYKTSKMTQFQRRLFALNQFSVVTVNPVLTGDTTVPVQVMLSERKKREAAIGVGGNVDSGLISLYGSFDFSHINLGNRLLSLDLNNQVGYAAYPSLDPSEFIAGPTLHHVARLYYPRFIKPMWAIGIELDYELGIQPAYRFSSPKVAPYFSWKEPLNSRRYRSIDAQFSYYFTGLTYFDTRVSESSLDDVVRLGYVGQQIVLDGRNDPIFTKQGRYLALHTYQATHFIGGDYDFAKFQIEARRFIPLINLGDIRIPGQRKTIRQWRMQRSREPFLIDGVFSHRLSMGALLPYQSMDGNSYAPNSEFFFLGGGNDVRGWQAQRLGPYGCENDTCTSAADIVPLGGTVTSFGTVEYRQYFPSDMGFALFADVGRVWSTLGDVDWRELQPSLGGGFRYISPIGPLRLDVACRLRDDPMFQLEDKCRVHFAFSESY